MTQDELAVMPIDRCIVMVRAFHPFYCHKFDITKHKNYELLGQTNVNYSYNVKEKVTTEKLPAMVYVPEDHIAVLDEETVKGIVQNNVKGGDEIMSDIDIPEDDELEITDIDLTDDESFTADDESSDFENYDYSEFEDEPISASDITGVILDDKAPFFDITDEFIYDSGLFFDDVEE